MTIEEAVEILRAHNEWRRYDGLTLDGPEMQDPKLIGIAIDTVCDHFRNPTKMVLTWQDVRRIVQIADELIMFPDFCDTEEHYYTEILKRLSDEDKS